MTNPFKKISVTLMVLLVLDALVVGLVFYELNALRALYKNLNEDTLAQTSQHVVRLNFGEYQKAMLRYQSALQYQADPVTGGDPFSNPVKVEGTK